MDRTRIAAGWVLLLALGVTGCSGASAPTTGAGGNGGGGGSGSMGGEETFCKPGASQACYSGPTGTAGVGNCKTGEQVCSQDGASFGICGGEVLPIQESCTTAVDDDCDGQINEDCSCTPSATEPCYGGPMDTLGIGICAAGTHTCSADGSSWSACSGQTLPSEESCATPVDDDCDGQVNEDCACEPAATESCYTGPMDTLGIGICATGTRTCSADGSSWSSCSGQTLPLEESCATPVDDDCDGQINEGCACVPGAIESCYSGMPSTLGVGSCQAGTRTCAADGLSWSVCAGQVLPSSESCTTLVDDDCDGIVNEDCSCIPGTIESCYDGPTNSLGMGVCVAGTHTCAADGKSWSACQGQVLPGIETCATTLDDDCDGLVNESCLCTPGTTEACYTGPQGSAGVGVCGAGAHTCAADGLSYGPCSGQVLPNIESCITTTDDDCDGQINENCLCVPGVSAACAYSGPAGTAGIGNCKMGTKICSADGLSYGACSGEVLPLVETCATPGDEDCDGQANEGCICTPGTTIDCTYGGPTGTAGVGACRTATRTCAADGLSYGPCTGEVLPATETCSTTVDDDCDGTTNEGCICTPGAVRDCPYGGPAGTAGVGICQQGVQTCATDGQSWSDCAGEVLPQTEDCSSSLDENCDGSPGCNGSHMWSKRFGNANEQHLTRMAVDGAGNVYLLGYFMDTITFGSTTHVSNPTGNSNIFLAKLDPNGVPLWSKGFGGLYNDQGNGLAVDSAGNVFIAGRFQATIDFGGGPLYGAGCLGCDDIFMATFDTNGNHLWSTRAGSDSTDEILDAAVDSQGSFYVVGNGRNSFSIAGLSFSTSYWQGDFFIAKIGGGGVGHWLKYCDRSAYSARVAVDSTGNVVFTRNLTDSIICTDVLISNTGGATALAKLNSWGTSVWSKALKGAYVGHVNVDDNDNVLVTGGFSGTINLGLGPMTAVSSDGFVAKYGSASNLLWVKQFNSTSGSASGSGVAADSNGNILVAGSFTGTINPGFGQMTSAGASDALVIKMDSNGNAAWAKGFGDAQDQYGLRIGANASSDVFFGGDFKGVMNLGGSALTATPGGGTAEWDIFVGKFGP